MSVSSREALDDRYVTLILRLLLDDQGHLLKGSLTDIDGKPIKWFLGCHDLKETLRDLEERLCAERANGVEDSPSRRRRTTS